jgi:hypothetical protein
MSKRQIPQFYRSEAWKVLRASVLRRDHGICAYCGGTATTADHVKPRSKGGPDDLSNLVAVCKECNEFFRGRDFATFSEKWAFHRAYFPLRKKRAEGKVKLEHAIEQLKWQKASIHITADERRQLRRKLVKAGYVFKFPLREFFCRYCHKTSKTGNKWLSISVCPQCWAENEKKYGHGRPFEYDAAVIMKRVELLNSPKNFLCPLCDGVTENSKVCRHCVPF